MAINLILPVADVDSIIGTAVNQFDSIRLYRATPTRGDTYVLLTTIALIPSTTQYPYTDSTGTSAGWYKITYYNSVLLLETVVAESQPFPATRGTTSLATLRHMVMRNMGGEVYTPDTFAAQTVVGASMVDSPDAVDTMKGWHLYRPTAANTIDMDKRVSAYDPATGKLTHANAAYVDQTVGTETIEVMPVDITLAELNEKIGEGLQRARFLYRWEFGGKSGMRQYNLPFFIEDPQYVVEMWKRFGTSAGMYQWQLFGLFGRWWRVRGSAFKCILDINPPQGESDVMALDVWRPGEVLFGEADFTLVHPLWAEAAAMVSVLEYLYNRDMVRHNSSNYATLLQSWMLNLRQRARAYGPTGGMRIQLPQPFRGFPEV